MSFNVVSRMAIFFSLVSFVYFGNVFNARQVFVVTTYFNFLYDSMVFYWPMAITSWTESCVGLRRIEEFLLLPEKGDNEMKSLPCCGYINYDFICDEKNDPMNSMVRSNFKRHNSTDANYIIFDNYSVLLSNEKNVRGIKNIELKLKSSCVIIGDVGSGKSTLLKAILGDLHIKCGQLLVSGALSYAAQEPWLFQATVRQNIVFTEPFDASRYETVIRVCALENDLRQWPLGDQTSVGECGATLSGGQRARINLARAVYRRADIYLLDDPLSAVDAQVRKFIAEKCFNGFLRGKMVVLATHQLQYVTEFKKLIVMNDGQIVADGDISQLNAYRIAEMQENDVNETHSSVRSQHLLLLFIQSKFNLILIAQNESHENTKIDDAMPTPVQPECRSIGAVKTSVYARYFKSMGNIWVVVAVICMLAAEQCAVGVLDYYVSHWYVCRSITFMFVSRFTKCCMFVEQGELGEQFKEK